MRRSRASDALLAVPEDGVLFFLTETATQLGLWNRWPDSFTQEFQKPRPPLCRRHRLQPAASFFERDADRLRFRFAGQSCDFSSEPFYVAVLQVQGHYTMVYIRRCSGVNVNAAEARRPGLGVQTSIIAIKSRSFSISGGLIRWWSNPAARDFS